MMDDGTADVDPFFDPSGWAPGPRNLSPPLNAAVYTGNKTQPQFTPPGNGPHTSYDLGAPFQSSPSHRGSGQALRAETVEFVQCWLRTHPNVFPSGRHIEALALLTGVSADLLNAWFAQELRRKGYPNSVSMSLGPIPSLATHSSSERQSLSSIRTPDTADAGQWPALMDSIGSGNNGGLFDNSLFQSTPFMEQPLAAQAVAARHDTESLQSLVREELRNDRAIVRPGLLHFVLDPQDGVGPQRRQRLLEEAAQAARDLTASLGNRCRRVQDDSVLKGASRKRWQCTRKCGRTFSNKKNWRRHEENGYPQQGWTCAMGETVLVDEVPRCSYCPLKNTPSINHVELKHSGAQEKCASSRQRARRGVFTRFQHLAQHFSRYHPGLDPGQVKSIFRFAVVESAFPRECGFCRTHFTSWDARINHISDHFEMYHRDMCDWQDTTEHDNSDFENNDDGGPPGDNNDDPDSDAGSDDESDSDGGGGPGGRHGKRITAQVQVGSGSGGQGSSVNYDTRNYHGVHQDLPSDEEKSASSDSSNEHDTVWSEAEDEEEDAASVISNEQDTRHPSPLDSEADESYQITLAPVQQWRSRIERTLKKAYGVNDDMLRRVEAANHFEDRGKHPLQRFKYGRETGLCSMPQQSEQLIRDEEIVETGKQT